MTGRRQPTSRTHRTGGGVSQSPAPGAPTRACGPALAQRLRHSPRQVPSRPRGRCRSAAVAGWTRDVEAQRLAAERSLAETTGHFSQTPEDIETLAGDARKLIRQLAKAKADATLKARLYGALGVRGPYHPDSNEVQLVAQPVACATERVGGPSGPPCDTSGAGARRCRTGCGAGLRVGTDRGRRWSTCLRRSFSRPRLRSPRLGPYGRSPSSPPTVSCPGPAVHSYRAALSTATRTGSISSSAAGAAGRNARSSSRGEGPRGEAPRRAVGPP